MPASDDEAHTVPPTPAAPPAVTHASESAPDVEQSRQTEAAGLIESSSRPAGGSITSRSGSRVVDDEHDRHEPARVQLEQSWAGFASTATTRPQVAAVRC